MLEKFLQNVKAENIRRWLSLVDLSSADVLQTERDIYAALAKSNKKDTWLPAPIAPFAEPVDLDALVGDLFNAAKDETIYQASRIDNYYQWLSDTNNVLKSEIETVEKQVTEATNAIQDISIIVGDENREYYWVSDSFNNSSFVDTKSTCLVDTDYGMVTLAPQSLETITNGIGLIDRQTTNGIPGANIYIIDTGKFGLPDKELDPVLESTQTRDLSALFDGDPSTWFEVERNFIPPRQKVKMQGRSYLATESGEEISVPEITLNYDWKAIVEWPDGFQDGGEDGNGKSIVEWRNIDTESPVLLDSNPLTNKNSPKVLLALEIILKQPEALSAIKILPLVREDSAPIVIESIDVFTDNNSITIAKEIELGSNRSTTKIQREILRRTGSQISGSLISIPTDRSISKIRFIFSSAPSKVKNGVAHIFKDILTAFRTERNHVLWRSVDKRKEWGRVPYSSDNQKITSSNTRPGIVGTVLNAASTVYSLGKIANSLPQQLFFSSSKAVAPFVDGVTKAIAPGTLGSIGSWLGKAVPVVGAVLALDQLVGGFFSVKKSSEILESKIGYDIFKAHRSAIALRDISLIKVKYEQESVLQTVKREFPFPVKKVGVFIDDSIPSHWGPGDWITYYLSVDGTNWISVPKLTDATLEKSLVLEQPTKHVFLKAIIKGNIQDPYHTPKIQHYAAQGVPA